MMFLLIIMVARFISGWRNIFLCTLVYGYLLFLTKYFRTQGLFEYAYGTRFSYGHNMQYQFCGITSIRHISQVHASAPEDMNPTLSPEEMIAGTRLGSDSHADTSCVNKHAYVETIVDGLTVDAIPFDSRIGKLTNLPIVHAIFAVDNITTFETHLIRLNHSIYIRDMEHSLLCPNQARAFGTIVDDVPPHLDHTGCSTFSLCTGNHSFPLESYGPTAFLRVRRPTDEELSTLQPIDITDHTGWDPYPQQLLASMDHENHLDSFTTDELEHPLDDFLLHRPIRHLSSLLHTKPRDKLTAAYLSKIWGCGLETARKTIEATTCRYYRHLTQGITRRFRTRRSLLRYRQLAKPAGEFYTDTMFAKVRSVRGFSCAQIYGNKFGFIKAYPMETNDMQNVGDTLSLLIQDTGVMESIHSDNAPEIVGRRTPFFKKARKEGINLTTIEPERHNENYGEILVDKAKLLAARLMNKRNVPMRLWCYCLEYACELESIMVPGMYRNKGRTGYEILFGSTPDISEYVEFEFYDYCWYWDSPQSYPDEKKSLGRWLGVAHRVGQAMVFYIMNRTGKVIAKSTVTSLEPSDYDVTEIKKRISDLDSTIHSAIGDYRKASLDSKVDIPDFDDEDLLSQLGYCFHLDTKSIETRDEDHYSNNNIPDTDDAPNADVESEAFDKFLGLYMEVPSGDGSSKVLARVKERKRDHDGNLIGRSDDNPILNTAVYNVESPDGTISEYTANIISENLWNQVDDDGYNYDLMHEIVGHRKDNTAVSIDDGYFITSSGAKRRVITTKGWQLNVRWENGETSWIALKDIKASNPVEVAEYAASNDLSSEPAFAWWVKPTLRRRDVIIKSASRRIKRHMKFGITIPQSYEEAIRIDRENGNTLWQDAIKKEMSNVEVAFKFQEDGTKIPIGFKQIKCHLIFDVKFTLERKARYVAGGHMTKVPASMTYSSVVSRDSVRIMFLIAALNDLDVKMVDIGNAYLNAETRERVWFIAGGEWGNRKGMKVIITRALYGLKSSGAEWKKTFSSYIKVTLGFDPCVGCDDDVYLRAEKDEHGNEYYSYIVCYVDDVLVINKDPEKYLRLLRRDFRLKSPPETPKMYLGADISRFQVPPSEGEGARTCWSMSADSHIKKALEAVEMQMAKDGVRFRPSNKIAEHPFSSQSYRPELDTSEYCSEDQVTFYQSLIGMLRWMCEIGRIDILTEVSMLSSHLATPRVGHLNQALYIFRYLKDHNRSKMVFDHEPVFIHDDDVPFEERALSKAKFMAELYPDAVEDIPCNAPKPRGKAVTITTFVDSDHAGDKMTRRSRTGVIIFVNRAPIIWYSKRQNTVETSTFGSEFVALKQAFEMVKSVKYKLRMFGIPLIENETKILGDNRAVILNASVPESTLRKKHHSVNYHFVRECVAAGIGLVMKVDTGENLADLFTKLLDSTKRKTLLKKILW